MRQEALSRRVNLAAGAPGAAGAGPPPEEDPDEALEDLWLLEGMPLSSRCG